MIIGFDASRAFINNRTGTENYSFQILKYLSKIDTKNNYKVYIRPGVNIGQGWPSNFQFTVINFQFLWTQVGLALFTFMDKLDVLFVPAHTLPLIRKPGLKTAVTVHDLGAEFLPRMHQLKQKLYLDLMTRFQLKGASHIIAVSQSTKNDLIHKIGLNQSRISVIYEGYDNKLFKPISVDRLRPILKRYDITNQGYFLFVGTIQPRKNLARLIKAYCQFLRGVARSESSRESTAANVMSEDAPEIPKRQDPEPKLILAGGKGWLSDEIYQLPKQLGIEDKVKFLGYVPDQDLPALYSGAIAFIFPSLFEGFGIPILEAMATHTPVITSNTSSLPEVAGNAAILINPESESEITSAMSRICLIGQRKKLIQAGITQLQKFSWDKAARQTLEILEQVANDQ